MINSTIKMAHAYLSGVHVYRYVGANSRRAYISRVIYFANKDIGCNSRMDQSLLYLRQTDYVCIQPNIHDQIFVNASETRVNAVL
jgi:hypothetical protein